MIREILNTLALIFMAAIISLFLYLLFLKPYALSVSAIFGWELENLLKSYESLAVCCLLLTTIAAVAIYKVVITIRYKDIQRKILVEDIPDKFAAYTKQRIDGYWSTYVIKQLNNGAKEYKDIQFQPLKTTYTLVGCWRAGKSVASGYFVKKLREYAKEAKSVEMGCEYYHDTLSFGNINESLSVFFSNLARITDIKEFKQLGRVSTPKVDASLSLGPLNIKWPLAMEGNLSQLRKRIFERLKKKKKIYPIVIDDMDRLLPQEQIQWLRTIELLGKFEGSIVLVVPVNRDILEESLENLNISRYYLDKILPNSIRVGADIDFIRDCFGGREKRIEDPSLRRKYAKYLYSLALRIVRQELSKKDYTKAVWSSTFEDGEISSIARGFANNLRVSIAADTTSHIGLESEYKINQHQTLRLSNGDAYENHTIVRLATNRFLNFIGEKPFNEIKESTLDKILNIHTLQKIFESTGFKITKEERNLIGRLHGKPFPQNEGEDFWARIGWWAVHGIESDRALARYFTYDTIAEEIDELINARNEDEAQILSRHIRTGKISR